MARLQQISIPTIVCVNTTFPDVFQPWELNGKLRPECRALSASSSRYARIAYYVFVILLQLSHPHGHRSVDVHAQVQNPK